MDLHDCGKFKLRRHRSAAGPEGAENSRNCPIPFGRGPATSASRPLPAVRQHLPAGEFVASLLPGPAR